MELGIMKITTNQEHINRSAKCYGEMKGTFGQTLLRTRQLTTKNLNLAKQ